MNYEKDVLMDDVSLDPSEMAEHWLGHSGLYMEYALEATAADKVAKRAAEKTKTVRSELIQEASKLEGKKLNVAETEAFYRTAPKYKEAKDEQIEAEYVLGMLQNAVSAFFRKEKSLDWLGRLLEKEYWAKPVQPVELPPGKRLPDHRAGQRAQTGREKLNEGRRQRRK